MAADNSTSPPANIQDLRGLSFHRLTVLAYAGAEKRSNGLGWNHRWECRCQCGRPTIVEGRSLKSGNIKSCGCLTSEAWKKNKHDSSTHRMRQSSEYQTWQDIKKRCYNNKYRQFHDYGGRGIVMCERWRDSFEAFYADMGLKPSPDHSIERIDNDGPYSPDNCKWATQIEQANNKRANHILTHDGLTMTIAQWARHTGLNMYTIWNRIVRLGWSAEQALSTPSKAEWFDDDIIREIRRRYEAGNVTQQELAEEFGIRQSKVSAIVRREAYKHVE